MTTVLIHVVSNRLFLLLDGYHYDTIIYILLLTIKSLPTVAIMYKSYLLMRLLRANSSSLVPREIFGIGFLEIASGLGFIHFIV